MLQTSHSESTWKAPDGVSLFTQEWLPEGEAKGVVLLVHGLGEHSSRYEHVAQFFTQAGYAFQSFDHRGHGRSEGIRGYLSYDQAIQDIQHFQETASSRFPGKPVFLYGQSLGGALILYYGMKKQPKLAGVIASSPGLIPAERVTPAKLMLAKIMTRVYPAFLLENGLDVTGLSHLKSVQTKYQSDPLVHSKISAVLGFDLIGQGEWMLTQKTFPVPLLLLQGSADRLVNPDGARKLAENLSDCVTYREYFGLYHELHNENESSQILAEILSWMEGVQ